MSDKTTPRPHTDGARPAETKDDHQTKGPPGAPAEMEPRPLDLQTPQFTLRAVLTGMALGAILSACNVYSGLKIGWGFNMSITAALLGYGFWMSLHQASGRRVRHWSILENNINQTACSSGASVSSAGLVAAVPALAMITGQSLDWYFLALWCFSVMLVGITVAIAIRQQMIVVDRLPFAFGIASAEMLKEMYARGSEAVARVSMLIVAGVIGAGVKIYQIVAGLSMIAFPGKIAGFQMRNLTFGIDPTLLFYAVGALIGFRACWSMLLGAVLAFGVVGPPLVHNESIRLRVYEPLPLVPADLDPKKDFKPEPEGYLKYDEGRNELIYKGHMSAAERDEFLALSNDPFYHEAINKLFIESDVEADAPTGDAADYTTTRRLRASLPLSAWPGEFTIPKKYDGVLRFDRDQNRLVALGPLTPEAAAAVLERLDRFAASPGAQEGLGAWWGRLTQGDAYQTTQDKIAALRAAVQQLAALDAAAFTPPQPLPAAVADKVTFVPGPHALRLTGVLANQEREALLAWAGDDADLQATVAALAAGSRLNMSAPNYTDMLKWLLWPGVTLMVVSALVSFSFSWRSILATVGLGRRSQEEATAAAPETTGDVARFWFITALAVALVLSVVLQVSFFGIVFWAAALGVLLTFALALVAARVSGETSITPVGAMGKVTQLFFGVLIPGNPAPNLMAANVTGGAASQCADLLHDMKCGYLLGALPRLQSLAQICGALAGSIAGSIVYLIIIPDPNEQLLTPEWPAPAVAAWKAVAELFMVGLAALPKGVTVAMLVAAAFGVLLPVLEKTLPGKGRAFVPSAASVGLAFVIPANYGITMFVGGLVALLLNRYCKTWSSRFLTAIAAGIVAGETLTGVGDQIRVILFG